MYDEYHVPTSEVLIYRSRVDEYVKLNRLETFIPAGSLVAFDGEHNVLLYGIELYKYSTDLFVAATASIKFNDISFGTQEEYRRMYTAELNEKAGFSNDIVCMYGNVSLNENSIASELINKGIKFSIKRMD